MELYNLDKRYKKFIETIVDGYVLSKSNLEDGSNPYITNPGMEVRNIFYDFTDELVCNIIFHKGNDNSINVCYVFDSKLINSECEDEFEAKERFIKIKRADFIYKLTLLKWLEDYGYIVLIDETNSNLFETGHITQYDRDKWTKKDILFLEETINSSRLFEMLSKYLNCRIIPSAQLIDIRENDFKTFEQRRFDKQNRTAKLGIIVAIVIGIVSPYISQCIEDDEQEKIEQIVNAINEQKILTIDNVKALPGDTFNVNIIQPKAKPAFKQHQD